MANINAVGNALTGSTGSGAFVGATSPTLVTPALGTPSSGTLTNCTGLPVAGGGTGAASFTAYAPVIAGTTSTGAFQSAGTGLSTTGYVLTSNGSSAAPSFQAISAGSGSLVYIDSVDASTSASIIFASGLGSSFRSYRLQITGYRPATNGTDLYMTLSTNGGSSYLGAYAYVASYYDTAGTTSDTRALASSVFVLTANSTSNRVINSSGSLSGTVDITSAYNSAPNCCITSLVSYIEQDNTAAGRVYSSGYASPGAVINAIKFTSSSGNITSGNITLWGLSA